MSNITRTMEIKRSKSRYCNTTATILVVGIVGILCSPTIPITLAIAATSGGIGYFGLKKIEKLNHEEKVLLAVKSLTYDKKLK
jgi:hypothetical protein